ncbi:hypothetical protein Tco_1044782 [Tanacetum coccineum]|uniref:Uncharacterized protein n=1 Tax=Tanacetum coccineum TaxID=301880 RepID=A0ABQ5GSV2_9ASTR
MKESHLEEIKMTRMAKAKENALNVEIQIISSENAQNYQETIIKDLLLEEHGVIAIKMEKKIPRTKNALWLKHLMRYFSFGRHLEDLHVTWAHLEKKRTRLRTNTKTLKDLCSQILETASQAIHDAVTTHKVTASQHFETALARTDSYANLDDSTYDGVTTKTRRRRVLENQLLSVSLLICLGKHDCVERIPSVISDFGIELVPLSLTCM